ncbi:tryptophan-rich sensory protein [Balneolales bacterium ANBcel1]|nr:tryptophan-rich sensory protein [Balneolales bacterium ANBcel1]
MSRLHRFLALITSIILAQAAGLIGSLATRPHIETWYRTIEKPGFTPPDWVFPVVWPTLYLLMAVAAWLVYITPKQGDRSYWTQGTSYESMMLGNTPSRFAALGVYGAQLVLNMLWSFLFFQWQMPGAALIEILILLMLIVLTTRLFYRIRPLAGYLMIPYILWVSYASVLNAAIWWLNS